MPREYTVRVFAAPLLRRTLVRKPPLSFVAAKKCTQVSNQFIHFNYILFIFLFFSFISIHIHTYIYKFFCKEQVGRIEGHLHLFFSPLPLSSLQGFVTVDWVLLLIGYTVFLKTTSTDTLSLQFSFFIFLR